MKADQFVGQLKSKKESWKIITEAASIKEKMKDDRYQNIVS